MGDIRAASPELELPTEETFVEAMRRAVKPPPDVYQRIVAANLSPAGVPDEQASEWELGKNQCAASLRGREADRGRRSSWRRSLTRAA